MIKRYKHTADKRAGGVKRRVEQTGRSWRLIVRKSNKYLYAQMVKLDTGKTVFGVKGSKAGEVGKAIAAKSKEVKISEVVFDRGAYRYHGNIKLLAEAAREAGLKF